MPALKNQRHELFAQAIAEGATLGQAAEAAGFSSHTARSQGSRLNRDTKIKRRIVDIKEQIVSTLAKTVNTREYQPAKFVRQAVQDRSYRLATYQDIVDRIKLLIEERSQQYKDVEGGGKSGLIVLKRMTTIGRGKKQKNVPEYAFDAAVLGELREVMRQSAIEVGDWENKTSLRVEKPEGEDLSKLTPDQLFQEQAILNEAIGRIEAIRAGAKPLEIEGSVEVVSEDVRPADLERE